MGGLDEGEMKERERLSWSYLYLSSISMAIIYSHAGQFFAFADFFSPVKS